MDLRQVVADDVFGPRIKAADTSSLKFGRRVRVDRDEEETSPRVSHTVEHIEVLLSFTEIYHPEQRVEHFFHMFVRQPLRGETSIAAIGKEDDGFAARGVLHFCESPLDCTV